MYTVTQYTNNRVFRMHKMKRTPDNGLRVSITSILKITVQRLNHELYKQRNGLPNSESDFSSSDRYNYVSEIYTYITESTQTQLVCAYLHMLYVGWNDYSNQRISIHVGYHMNQLSPCVLLGVLD